MAVQRTRTRLTEFPGTLCMYIYNKAECIHLLCNRKYYDLELRGQKGVKGNLDKVYIIASTQHS